MQQENKKWYAINYLGFWQIENEKGNDVMDYRGLNEEATKEVGENAKLCASAPEMKELLDDTMEWLDTYASIEELNKNHPMWGLLSRYEKLTQNGK